MNFCVLFPLVLLACSASAQIISGTLVVFHIAKDKLVVAGDSRAIFNGVPDDSYCKIAAFHSNFIYFTSGASGYRPIGGILDPVSGFNNIDEATIAIRARVPGKNIEDIADVWASSLTSKWRSLRIFHPDLVVEAGKNGKGVLAVGFFAEAVQGKIVLTARAIIFDAARPEPIISVPIQRNCTATLCATGMTDIFDEYTALPPSSSRAERENIMRPTGDETARVMRLVQLSILYSSPKGLIGGSIDALELWNNGRIHWVARKDNCPENQDESGILPATQH